MNVFFRAKSGKKAKAYGESGKGRRIEDYSADSVFLALALSKAFDNGVMK